MYIVDTQSTAHVDALQLGIALTLKVGLNLIDFLSKLFKAAEMTNLRTNMKMQAIQFEMI